MKLFFFQLGENKKLAFIYNHYREIFERVVNKGDNWDSFNPTSHKGLNTMSFSGRKPWTNQNLWVAFRKKKKNRSYRHLLIGVPRALSDELSHE